MTETENTGEGGNATTTTVTYKASYYVVETAETADAGYVLATTYSTEGMNNPSATASEKALRSAGTITIINEEMAGVELPSTGGPGTILYTMTGLALIALVGILLMKRRRYNK